VKLTEDEARQLYRLLHALLAHVHLTEGLEPPVETAEDYARLPPEAQCSARVRLSEKPELLATFLEGQRAQLTPEDVGIVEEWRRVVPGKFTVVKALKSGAVLCGGPENRHYLVLGIEQPLEAALGGWPLPAFVETRLLPFKGRIVYDGILARYPVLLGSGMRGSANRDYQAARRRGQVLTSLTPLPPSAAKPPARPRPDRAPQVNEIVRLAGEIRGGDTCVESPAYSLLRAAASLAALAAAGETCAYTLHPELSKARRALTRLQNVLYDE